MYNSDFEDLVFREKECCGRGGEEPKSGGVEKLLVV